MYRAGHEHGHIAAKGAAVSTDAARARLRLAEIAGAVDADSHADRVHRELRRALLVGEIPLTARLTEEQLAERFQTSRTPVRDAIRRLETEGHLVRERNGGVRPNAPRASTMREIYEVRLVLEELVVRRAAGRASGIDVGGLQELRDDWAGLQAVWPELADEFELPEFVHADESFHETLARVSGNHACARHLRDVNERIRLLRIHDFVTEGRIEATIAQHLAIADAVVAGDTDGATSLMRRHIEDSAGVAEQRVGDLLARMLDAEPVNT